MFEDVALAAWHSGDVRAVSAAAVATVCRQSGLERKLAAFERGAEKGAVSLLAAFYVRQAGFTAAGERSFEFTHKSFGEFLVARPPSVGALRRLASEMNCHRKDTETGWDEHHALVQWAELTGYFVPLPAEIFSLFSEREIARKDKFIVSNWQKWLSRLSLDCLPA